MKRIMFLVVLCLPLLIDAQMMVTGNQEKNNPGIQWTEGLSWKEVQKKAKKENKYIFMDCFATWCGPCKAMEKEVFSNSEVGDYFNQHFISVRLQLDKTGNDNAQVRDWYSSASAVSKEFGIPGYPTFLFFSPNGQLVYRDLGFIDSKQLVEKGRKAMQPGFNAPYLVYYSLLAKYQQGKRDYATMAGLADTAKLLGQTDIAASVSREYRRYLIDGKERDWYRPANLIFMANFIQGSKDPFFHIFFRNANVVDSLLRKVGIAESVVDAIINEEEIEPITKPVKGMQLSTNKPKAEKEPDWEGLRGEIAVKYSEGYATRNVLLARIQWYNDHHKWAESARYLVNFVKECAPIYIDGKSATFLNFTCWIAVFMRSVDKEQIDTAISVMKYVIGEFGTNAQVLDTYANLLYKAGRIDEAILFEENAGRNSPNDSGIEETIRKMKQSIPTWPHYIDNDEWNMGGE